MIEKSHVRIHVLDPHVVNKIAAGEVVERPASVVKELVENALDAHARTIEIHVEQGGRRLVRVVDDGWGMGPEDLASAFVPHATSKLSTVEDLDSIATLGFRGEALASIGAVAQARILSREREAEAGYAVENRGGAIHPPRVAPGAPGTDVTVRNLFFNTPARERFLRSVRTELGHIEEVVRRFALARPETGFLLRHDGTELLRVEPDEDRPARLRRILGPERADRLIAFRVAFDAGSVEGFLSPPDMSRPDARELHFFVNGRLVRDKILHRVVRDAYRDVLPYGRFPQVYLFLEVDPTQVDVNVHPTKAEVRWRDARFLHAVVGPAAGRALRGADLAVGLEAADAGLPRPDGHGAAVRGAVADFLRRQERIGNGPPPAYRASGTAVRSSRLPLSAFQVHDAYLVCEVEDGLAVVDQHALHERALYDRLLRRLTEGGVEAQRLLVPEQVEMGAADRALLDEHTATLRRCGFEWSPFGEDAVALEAIPSVVPREAAADLLRDLAALLRARGSEVDTRILFHDVADTMACKAAVRFGDRLSREEAVALLEETGALERGFVCPHGRPSVLRITFDELERRFGRR